MTSDEKQPFRRREAALLRDLPPGALEADLAAERHARLKRGAPETRSAFSEDYEGIDDEITKIHKRMQTPD